MTLTNETMVRGLSPNPSPLVQLQFSLIMLTRHIANNPKLLQDFYKKTVEKPLIEKVDDQSIHHSVQEIPRIQVSDIPSEGLQPLFHYPVPIVIEGFASDSEAVQHWTPEFLREKYGNIEVPYFEGKNYWETKNATLKELIDDILAGGKTRKYVNNIADIFQDVPELQKGIPIEKFSKYMGNRKHNKTQIFLGGPETGTGLHCANKFNLFVMVYGEKRWNFVHPKHTPLLYPISQKNFQFVYAPIAANFDHDHAAYPLIQSVPRYTTVLKPGDVLVNPPWWWHAVENLTPSSIGVATRWMTPWESIDGWKTNPLFSCLEKMTFHYWKFAIKYYLFGIARRDSDGRMAH